MNWKTFKNKVIENENITFIDRIKSSRGLSEVRTLRFFFCGNFKPICDRFKGIGFYVVIEKSNGFKGILYHIWFCKINFNQKSDREYLRFTDEKATKCYLKVLDKINKMMKGGN